MPAPLRRYLGCLGFLTRLAPARVAPDEEIADWVAWLPAVGLTLGAVLVLPFRCGLLAGHPWVQAWLAVVLNVWLTRGLHYDGLADVADGMGQHTSPERFWTIIKDSRCGPFGVLALVLAVAGQLALWSALFAAGRWGGAAWAIILGRQATPLLGFFTRDLTRPGLGRLFLNGADGGALVLTLCQTAAFGLLLTSPSAVLFGLVLLALVMIPLHRLARFVGGVNGDFLGAAILLGELVGGLAALSMG